MHGKRYYQKSTGSSGYSPVCNNQFIRGLCTKGDKSKPRIKCVDCEHQNFETITLKEFESHIKGLSKTHDDVLGAYAIDRDAMCSFIVADFDAKNDTADGALDSLQDSVATFMRLCERHTIPTYLERSRSGKGFHIWLFFDSPVPAKDARRLFCSLITDAMEENPRISFASYDRLFPHQDTIPSTGFGNLIALPLQGGVGKLGCSVFVDGYFNPYPDQWVFLSHVKRFTYADLKSILMRISHRTDIGNLADASVEELHEKPWEKKQPELPLVQQDFTGTLTIVEANMLHIKKDQLSTRAHNRIKRLAAFRNPEFYEAQKMHRDTAIFPRVLSTSDETNEYLSLPRGIKDSLLVMLNEGNIDYDLVDKMQHGNRIHATFKGMLREEQASAANALLAHDTGVLEATTGFGKTIIGISLIAHRSVNTLILVNNKNLLTQWKTTLGSFLDIADEPLIYLTPTGRERKCPTIGEYSGAKKRLSGLVDIAMMQSLFRNGEVSDIVKNYGVVIIDECHHVPSFTFTSVLKEVSARYVYGLTATPERKDGHESILYAHCGPTRYKVNPLDQARKRPFEQFVVPRFTNSLPEDANEKFNITKLYGTLASDHRRNELIITDIIACIEADRSPLVLTERTEHVAELARLLKTRFSNVLTVTGKMSDLEKRTFLNRIQDMGENEQFIIVATGKFIGEGFDFDRLDTLFLTLPISWKGTITQYTGRLHRLHENKVRVEVYDYVDVRIPQLERMYRKRLIGYKAVGYKVAPKGTSAKCDDIIYGADDYQKAMVRDLEHAHNEIVLCSPHILQWKVETLLPLFKDLQTSGTTIKILAALPKKLSSSTKLQRDKFSSLLDEANVLFSQEVGFNHQFLVIDKRIAWYGSINFLGNNSADDGAIRIIDPEIATALLDQIKQ